MQHSSDSARKVRASASGVAVVASSHEDRQQLQGVAATCSDDEAHAQDAGLVAPAVLLSSSAVQTRQQDERAEEQMTTSGACSVPSDSLNADDQAHNPATGGGPYDVDAPATQFAEEQDLEVDDFDSDSAVGTDTESLTASITESMMLFREENGRTYHTYKDGSYVFPNDEREQDRLDLQHNMFMKTYGNRLHFAPLKNPKNAIDIGTGTGIWALDFADEYPECEVLGIDLSPPSTVWVPPNLKFLIEDAEAQWQYSVKFDYIHARIMAGCFKDWKAFFRQAYDNLEPGGWLELQDYGLPIKSADGTSVGTYIERWGELLCEAARKIGYPMGSDVSDMYVQWMQEIGFVDVQQQVFMWPTNGWPKDPFMKELGMWNMVNIIDGLEGFCLRLLMMRTEDPWTREEVDILVARATADLKNRNIHAYFPMPVTFARRPYPGEVAFA